MESNLKQMTKHRRSKDESIKKLRSMAGKLHSPLTLLALVLKNVLMWWQWDTIKNKLLMDLSFTCYSEPTGVLPLGEVEPKNRRSLETLHSISQHSRNSEEHSRGRLKSAVTACIGLIICIHLLIKHSSCLQRQDHFNPIKHPSTLKHTSSSSSCRHKSAPSSPTLPRHLEHNHQQLVSFLF